MITLDDSYIAIAEKKLNAEYKDIRNMPHVIIGSTNKQGAIGIELHEDMVWITFAYSDGTFKTHRELIEIMRWAYEFYTVKRHLPILYTGLENMFKNVSIEVSYMVWQYIPRRYLNCAIIGETNIKKGV